MRRRPLPLQKDTVLADGLPAIGEGQTRLSLKPGEVFLSLEPGGSREIRNS